MSSSDSIAAVARRLVAASRQVRYEDRIFTRQPVDKSGPIENLRDIEAVLVADSLAGSVTDQYGLEEVRGRALLLEPEGG
jgi:hypothetical protein